MRIWAPMVIAAGLSTLPTLNGCTALSPTRGGFSSNAPAAQTWAVEQTVLQAEKTGVLKRKDLESMVELLLSNDSLVRFVAISGLTELTGQCLGYRFFDPPETRYQAVLDWRKYARTASSAGKFKIEPQPDGSSTPTQVSSVSKAISG